MSPDDWKELAKFSWGLLLLPVGVVWKKANGSVQKEDFKESMREMTDALKEHSDRDRDTFIKLFEKLEQQGKGIERIETTLTFISPNRSNGPSERR